MSPSPDPISIENEIAAGWNLFNAGREEETIEHFRRLAERYPNDPRAHFEFGGSLDAAGGRRSLDHPGSYQASRCEGENPCPRSHHTSSSPSGNSFASCYLKGRWIIR
ncbi:MAG: hypothetical protein H0U04_10760 [Rubrobacter sp.]|nr:hypothetical protein [Rubrobacter sp.]